MTLVPPNLDRPFAIPMGPQVGRKPFPYDAPDGTLMSWARFGNELERREARRVLNERRGFILATDGSVIGRKDISDRDFLAPLLETDPGDECDGPCCTGGEAA